MILQFTIFTADCVGSRKNCLYPNRQLITDKEKLRAAVAWDHVCAEYKGAYRSNANFVWSDVICMDVDNDHSDNPEDWVITESLGPVFGDLDYALVFSRNHLKEKDGRSARPRFHLYFRIRPVTDPLRYASLKQMVFQNFRFFDSHALDAGRFLFATPNGEVIWHEGRTTIDEVLVPARLGQTIPEGRRNATLSRIAGRIVKRYGFNEDSFEISTFLPPPRLQVPRL